MCQGGSQDLRNRQIWANENNFLCSSPISVRRTFAIFIFLKLRKLASMFLVFARISSDFGLNSKKIWLYSQKNGKKFACLEQKNAHYAGWMYAPDFRQLWGKLILGPLSQISLLNPYLPPAVIFLGKTHSGTPSRSSL